MHDILKDDRNDLVSDENDRFSRKDWRCVVLEGENCRQGKICLSFSMAGENDRFQKERSTLCRFQCNILVGENNPFSSQDRSFVFNFVHVTCHLEDLKKSTRISNVHIQNGLNFALIEFQL